MEQKKNVSALASGNQVAGAQRSEEAARCSPDHWPRALARLRNAAVLAVKSATSIPPSPREREEPDDLMIVLRAMADPRKTLSVHVAMTAAAGMVGGRPLSGAEQREGDELCRGFGQTDLTDDERRAVERLAKKRQWSV